MRKLLSTCVLIAFIASSSVSIAKGKPEYIAYNNAKYNYTVLYPSFLQPLGEPDAHDGQRFESDDSSLKMRAWGTYANWSGEERSIAEEEKWTIENLASSSSAASDPKLSYRANAANWFVISDTAGNTIFYQRTVKGGGPSKDDLVFASVWFEYPKADKAKYDAAVKKVSRSLQALAE